MHRPPRSGSGRSPPPRGATRACTAADSRPWTTSRALLPPSRLRAPCRDKRPWRSAAREYVLADRRDHLVAECSERGVLSVVLQVEREVTDAEACQLRQACDLGLGRSDHAEPLDDLVGDELGVGIAGTSVLVVVIPLTSCDVVGKAPR